jgi:FkbM family methyltransferase
VIVDLGANIGLASLFFAARYPRATVLALEPDPANFAMLSHNVAGVGGRILSVQGAIWSEDRDLRVLRSDANGVPLGDWGVQVGNVAGAGTIEVAGWSMARLIRDHCLGQIDILKIDIEGAEKELFEAEDLGWLASVEMVMIETHERFRPGCNAAVLKMLDCGFALRPGSGENAVFVRERLARSPDPRRRQVIVTPYLKEDRATLERCIASVRDQTVATDHILVADGHPQDWIDALPVRHIRLDRAHADFGNTPRGIGSLMAISEDYEGIGFLDADNWLEPDHVTRCLEAQAADPSADYVIARWNLRRPDGTILALPFDAGHVDTNCFFFLPGSFHMLPHFSMMHRELSLVGDRVFFMALNGAKLRAATLASPSVNYSCLWPTSYRMAGEEPPPEAKRDIDSSHLVPWLQRQTPRDLEIISRRAGVRFGG